MHILLSQSHMLRRLVAVLASVVVPVGVGRGGDRVTVRPIAPGVEFRSIHRMPGPREIRVIRVLRAESLISLEAALAHGTVRGVERLSGIVQRVSRPGSPVVAAVNADFFCMGGQVWAGCALGPVVRAGELLQTGGGRLCFYDPEEQVDRYAERGPG